jgi:Aspartyl protease
MRLASSFVLALLSLQRLQVEPVVPLESFGGNPLVQVRVNGSKPVWFLLDTASSWMFVDAALAQAIGLKTRGGRTIMGGGDNPARITFADGVTFDLAGTRATLDNVAVMPLTFKYDRPIAGLVGGPFLKRFVVRLECGRREMTLHDPAVFEHKGHGQAIPFRIEDEIPVIQVEIGIGTREPVVGALYVDTGASQRIILTRPFVETHKLIEAAGTVTEKRAGSLTGGTSYLETRAASVKIGSIVLKDVTVGFSQDRRGSGASTTRAGIIGNGILSQFAVTLDYVQRRMVLENCVSG